MEAGEGGVAGGGKGGVAAEGGVSYRRGEGAVDSLGGGGDDSVGGCDDSGKRWLCRRRWRRLRRKRMGDMREEKTCFFFAILQLPQLAALLRSLSAGGLGGGGPGARIFC